MAKRQKKDSSVETAVLESIGEHGAKKPRWMLTKFKCGHVGMETGVKAKAFIRWGELRMNTFEEETKKKCPDCK